VAVVFGSPGLCDVFPVFEVILEAAREAPFPIYPVLPSTRTASAEAARFREAGGFYFTDEVALGKALGRLRSTPPPAPGEPAARPTTIEDPAATAALKAPSKRQLRTEEVFAVLRAAGFELPRQQRVTDAAEAARCARDLGWPVVLKVVGPLHKSEVGGVALDLRSVVEVEEQCARLLAIPGAEGVLVQEQVAGVELILGALRERPFGHLILCGWGGIYTEVLHDISVGLAPLSLEEARRMIRRSRASALLAGQRGREGADLEMVADCLVRLGALVQQFPEITELDINPLVCRGPRLVAVDARITLAP
jgi:acetyltransferase